MFIAFSWFLGQPHAFSCYVCCICFVTILLILRSHTYTNASNYDIFNKQTMIYRFVDVVLQHVPRQSSNIAELLQYLIHMTCLERLTMFYYSSFKALVIFSTYYLSLFLPYIVLKLICFMLYNTQPSALLVHPHNKSCIRTQLFYKILILSYIAYLIWYFLLFDWNVI